MSEGTNRYPEAPEPLGTAAGAPVPGMPPTYPPTTPPPPPPAGAGAGTTEGTSTTDTAKQEASAVAQTAGEGAREVTDTAREQAGETAQVAKEKAQETAGLATEKAKETVAEARSQARDLYEQGRAQLTDQAGSQQRRLAGGLRSFSGELTSMADGAQEQGMASDLARQASSYVDRLGRWFDGREPGDVVDEVSRYARRHPGTFLAVAAGLGLLAGRVARSLKDESASSAAG